MAIPAYKMDYAYTYKDYCNWPDDERWEILEGIPVAMSPAPTPEHQLISVRLLEALIIQKQKLKDCIILHAPVDVLLADTEEAYTSDETVKTVVQPDILVVCDSSKVTKRGIKGAPDLVMEIISPSTVSRDMTVKKDLYEKYGVREYWIVQPRERIVIVYGLENGIFGKASVYTENEQISLSILPEIEVNLKNIFPE
jgi:Uma2 family endonuclease